MKKKKRSRVNNAQPGRTESASPAGTPSSSTPPSVEQDQVVGEAQQRRGSSRSEDSRSEGASPTNAPSPSRAGTDHVSEVEERPLRRTFAPEEKLRILREIEQSPENRNAIMRKEGIYSSYIYAWRRERAAGELDGLAAKKRGPAPKKSTAERDCDRLLRENARLREELRKAGLIIDAQKKVTQIYEELSSQQAPDVPFGSDS